MTVETSSRKQTFAGGQTNLTFTFRALSDHPEYIKVKKVVVATSVESDLVYNTDFTVAVDADGVGGTVTLTPTFSTAFNFVVYRDTDLVQESDYDDFNQFPANTLEENLDQLTMIVQEQAEDISRVITFPISSNPSSSTIVFPAPESDKVIGWNTAATALENKTISSLGGVVQASTAEAQAATNNTNYMTPFLVKTEVEFPGAVLIPASNIVTGSTANITVTNATITTATIGTATITTATITNLTVSTINITTLKVGTPTTGTILIHNGTSFAANNGSQGTAGQALLSNGAGAAPSFGTISGGMSLVSNTALSSVTGASISITNSNYYQVFMSLTTLSTASSIQIRANNDSGSNRHGYRVIENTIASTSNTLNINSSLADTKIEVGSTFTTSDTNVNIKFDIFPQNGTQNWVIRGKAIGHQNGATLVASEFYGNYSAGLAVTTFLIFSPTGAPMTGNIYLYQIPLA